MNARRAAAAFLVVFAAAAWAQNASEEARKLAQRLGSERSVEGLETIVAARNRELLEWYERGWRDTSQRQRGVPVPEAIEAIVVKNYRDPTMGPVLRTLVSANWTPYRSRELFDLMFEEWRSGKERPATYPIRDGIFRTQLAGIEAPALAWLAETPGPGEYDANAIMHFLSERKYGPAVPVMARKAKERASGDGRAIVDWLLAIGSEDAVAAVVERLAWLRDRSGGIEERVFIANRLVALPESARLDLDAFEKAIGPTELRDPRYAAAARMLADPSKHRAIQAAQAREAQAEKKRAGIASRVAEAERLRSSDPKGYVEAMQSALGDAGETQEVGMGWLQLGNFARFRLRDPRRALELYGRAERTGMGFAIFAQGDTWQFDLRDKQRAIAEYRRNLEQLGKVEARGIAGDMALAEWGRRWLAAQIAFLETGRTFTGDIGRDDVAGVGVLTMFAGMPSGGDDDLGLFPGGRLDPADIPRRLADLPASGWTLMRAAPVLGGMPDAKSILAFLARNDPAGYASACFFGLVDLTTRTQAEEGGMVTRGANRMFGGSKALQEAKTQFLRQRRINLLPLPLRQ